MLHLTIRRSVFLKRAGASGPSRMPCRRRRALRRPQKKSVFEPHRGDFTAFMVGQVRSLVRRHLGKGVEEFARPFAMALAVVGAIVVVSMILYWRRKEQELAAVAERDIPGQLQAEQSGQADG